MTLTSSAKRKKLRRAVAQSFEPRPYKGMKDVQIVQLEFDMRSTRLSEGEEAVNNARRILAALAREKGIRQLLKEMKNGSESEQFCD